MDLPVNFDWIEAVGWLATLLTIASYSVVTMLPLRLLAIGSSVCFALYAAILQLWPLLAMELVLLPINLYRFWQLFSLRGRLERTSGSGQPDFSVIRPYGQRERFAAGAAVFERGDKVDRLYYIAKGQIEIEGLGIDLSEGDVFGEIAFFSHAATRMATARCVEEAEVYSVDEKIFLRLQFEDPGFGLAILRTITRRLIENARQAELSRAVFGDAAYERAQPAR